MKRLSLLVLLLLVLLLSACSGDSPEAAMREWFEAALQSEGLRLADRTCSRSLAQAQDIGMLGTILGLGAGRVLGQEIDIQSDLGQLRFETIANSGSSARVRVSGTVRVAFMGVFQDTPIDYTADMIREDNRWKWCGP